MKEMDKQQINGLLSEIYEVVLEPGKLPELASSLVSSLDLHACALMISNSTLTRSQILAEKGWGYLSNRTKQKLNLNDLLKQVVADEMVTRAPISKGELVSFEMSNELWLSHLNYEDQYVQLSLSVLDRDSYSCVLFVSELGALPSTFTEQHFLLKHLHNALRQLNHQIRTESLENHSLNALEKAGRGVVLFNQDRYPIHINDVAKALLDSSVLQLTPMGLQGGSIELTEEIDQTHRQSIQEKRTLMVNLEDWQEGESLSLFFMPLSTGPSYSISDQDMPVSAIFIRDLREELVPPKTLLRDYFGLSPREVEVAVLISQNFSPIEISEKLGIKIFTVKRHLSHVFEKMGVNSQSKLCSMLLKLVNSENDATNLDS